ncbi:YHS domain-containing (seleno)protein [Ekhidna sp.]|uniref:YHS domain-containing (seleno)protein n=1 Tax=Ekhidna sp. TaxID=2608089 RepID=UPI003BADB897
MKIIKIIAIIILGLFAIGLIAGKASGISLLSLNMHDEIYSEDGMALGGYDPVQLYANGEAILGNEDIQTDWKDLTWRFTTEENQSTFLANPEQYIPASGGHCAFAVGKGFAAPGNPNFAYRTKDGKVYLFSNKEVMEDAMNNIDQVVRDADINWDK